MQDADILVSSLESDGEKQASELVKEARQQIHAMRKKTEKQVNDQVRQARQALSREVGAVAETIMENVLHRRLSS